MKNTFLLIVLILLILFKLIKVIILLIKFKNMLFLHFFSILILTFLLKLSVNKKFIILKIFQN